MLGCKLIDPRYLLAGLLSATIAGCHGTKPACFPGYDAFVDDFREPHPGLAAYLDGLRPPLSDRFGDSIQAKPDTGQDFMVMLVLGYWEASVFPDDLADGSFMELLPAGQLRDGYPGYFMIEDQAERWYQVPIRPIRYTEDGRSINLKKADPAGYKIVREVRALMSMDMPEPLINSYGGYKHPDTQSTASLIDKTPGRLFGYPDLMRPRINEFTHFVYVGEGVWGACDVYLFYGRLDGKRFARVYINPDLEALDAAIDGREMPIGWGDSYRELTTFDRLMRRAAAHQGDWPRERDLEEKTWQQQPFGPSVDDE